MSGQFPCKLILVSSLLIAVLSIDDAIVVRLKVSVVRADGVGDAHDVPGTNAQNLSEVTSTSLQTQRTLK
jgi:hypothetical protein